MLINWFPWEIMNDRCPCIFGWTNQMLSRWESIFYLCLHEREKIKYQKLPQGIRIRLKTTFCPKRRQQNYWENKIQKKWHQSFSKNFKLKSPVSLIEKHSEKSRKKKTEKQAQRVSQASLSWLMLIYFKFKLWQIYESCLTSVRFIED